MKYYRVKKIEKTVSEILVVAKNKADAERVAQLDHVDQGKDEVLETYYEPEVIGYQKPKGEIAYTENGYIEADGNKVNINE